MKVSVIGMNNIGMEIVYSLLFCDPIKEIGMFDRHSIRGKKQLIEASNEIKGKNIITTNIKSSDIVFVCKGVPEWMEHSKPVLYSKNRNMMISIAKLLKQKTPKAEIILITQPSDMLSYHLKEFKVFPIKSPVALYDDSSKYVWIFAAKAVANAMRMYAEKSNSKVDREAEDKKRILPKGLEDGERKG